MICLRFPPLVRAAALAALPACLLMLGSCTEDLPAAGNLSEIGVIEGRVTEAGVPVPARVAVGSAFNGEFQITASAWADSNGWYRLELPIGLYGFRVSFDGSASNWYTSRDTVSVGRAVRRKDIPRGRARVELQLPSVFDGTMAWMRFDGAGYDLDYMSDVEDQAVSCDLRLAPLGDFIVRLDLNRLRDDVIVLDPLNGAQAETLRVGPDAVATMTYDFRPRHSSLEGRVTSSPLLPARDVRVDLYNAVGRRIAETWCNDDGRFRFDLLEPASVRLHSVYASVERWFGGASLASAAVHELQPGTHLTGIDLAGGGLRLAFEGPGDFVGNDADVLVRAEDGAEYLVNNPGDNPLILETLPPGRVQVLVLGGCAGEPWRPQWYDGAASDEEAAYLDIVAGEVCDAAFTLLPGGAISGRFTWTSEEFPWGARATIHDLQGSRLCAAGTPVRDGLLDMRGLPDGTFLLGLYVSSSPWWYPGTWLRNEAVPVTITDGSTVADLVWPLPFPYGKAAR